MGDLAAMVMVLDIRDLAAMVMKVDIGDLKLTLGTWWPWRWNLTLGT